MTRRTAPAAYNPDVLSCIANLSNDEVFTPPEVANALLDMLPPELFRSPDTTFLDPAVKSGVFLREIAKRLLVGLADVIPDLQQRVDHIFQKQLYGIAITELTGLLARRSVYCSKHPNGAYSVSKFPDIQGNIRFKRVGHRWRGGRCTFCGASEAEYGAAKRGEDMETHAYEWIHTPTPGEIFNMKFDVIISNPPYQLSDGGNAASALPIYQYFIRRAKLLAPRYITMIVPSRWFVGGRGLDEFRHEMLNDDRIRIIHDFPNASDCFPGVEIKGGICYFLWTRDTTGPCTIYSHNGDDCEKSERPLLEKGMDTFIRNDMQIRIFEKVLAKGEVSFASILHAGRYFGFHTKVVWTDGDNGFIQTADGKDRIPITKAPSAENDIKIYIHGGQCWASRSDIPKNGQAVKQYKILLPRSGNPGGSIIGRPKISEPGSCSSNTYVVATLNEPTTKEMAENMLSYIKSKFFRYMVSIKTATQDMAPKAYALVPLQDFHEDWTDEKLYKKYGLTADEIAAVENAIPAME